MKIKFSKYQAENFASLLQDMQTAPEPKLKEKPLQEILYFHIIKEMFARYYTKLYSAGTKGITINFKITETLAIYHFTNTDTNFYNLYQQIHQNLI